MKKKYENNYDIYKLKEREEKNKNLGESINYANLLPLHEYVIMQSIKSNSNLIIRFKKCNVLHF